jgi:hypothetical protein
VGVAYSVTIVGSGGTAPYSFGVTSGTLPSGLTLTPSGVLAGTPTTAGTSTVTIRGTDANGCFATVVYTIVVAAELPPPANCPAITLSPSTTPNGTIGVAYSQTFTAAGGTSPYRFGVTAGALPTGLTLSPTGLLSGTPTTAGTSSFTMRATDANGCFVSLSFTVVIAAALPPPAACPVITLLPASPANPTVGVAYNQQFTGSGGSGPYVFGITAGTLPAGLTFTPAGLMSGTPTTTGSSTFTLRVTDASGCFAERAFTVTLTTAVPTLPQAFVLFLALGLTAVGYFRLRRSRAA